MVVPEQLTPGAIAKRDSTFTRADDVREQDRREDALRFGLLPSSALPDPGQESLDLFDDRLAVSDPGKVILTGKLDVDGAGDLLRRKPRVPDVAVSVPDAVNDQRRYVDRGQDRPGVGLRIHPGERDGRRRTRAESQPRCVPAAEVLVIRFGRRVLAKMLVTELGGSPTPLQLFEFLPPIELPVRPLPLRQPVSRQEGPVEDECRRPLRICGREQCRHCRALRVTKDGGPFRPDGIHDRANVVHPRLEIRNTTDPIGNPGSALVENDQAAERRESLVEALERRLLPAKLEIRDRARREDQIERPISHNLIGDRNVAAFRIARFRPHGHSVARHPDRR